MLTCIGAEDWLTSDGHEPNHEANFITSFFPVCGMRTEVCDGSIIMNFYELLEQSVQFVDWAECRGLKGLQVPVNLGFLFPMKITKATEQ